MHTEVTRHDEALKKIFGWKQSPAQDVYKRYFAKFTQVTNQRVSDHFYSWVFKSVQFDHYTLDCDSSVFTRYGEQKGANAAITRTNRAGHPTIPLSPLSPMSNWLQIYSSELAIPVRQKVLSLFWKILLPSSKVKPSACYASIVGSSGRVYLITLKQKRSRSTISLPHVSMNRSNVLLPATRVGLPCMKSLKSANCHTKGNYGTSHAG